MSPQGNDEPWTRALRLFDRDLRRHGAADRTRRAYGGDIGRLATWAIRQDLAPGQI
ncbi:MAG: hypothetical protein H0U80_05365, partial [Solirubrobacterales bacterium]|nr:hypothetical protein [Solirubrobacterales bacterium]